jgi:hypothetical protein
VGDDHAPDSELVARSLRGEVEEGPGDVAGAVAEEEDGLSGVNRSVGAGGLGAGIGKLTIRNNLLRMPRRVRRAHAQHHHKRRIVRPGQVVRH